MKTILNKPPWRDRPFKTILLGSIAAVIFAALPAVQAGTVTNLPPIAANDTVQCNQDSRLRVRVAKLLANDTAPNGDGLTLISVSPTSAAGGTAARRARWIVYTPPPGFTNADSFSYVIADSTGLTATGLVSVTVRADLDPSENIAIREVLGNGDTRIQFMGIPGRTYQVQSTESLAGPHWHPLGNRVADATGQFEFIETPATNSPVRFYRSTNP